MSEKRTSAMISKTQSEWLHELSQHENTTKRNYLDELIYRDYIVYLSKKGEHSQAGRFVMEYDFGMNPEFADDVF